MIPVASRRPLTKWTLCLLLLERILSNLVSAAIDSTAEEEEFVSQFDDPHPDPNEEHYDDMVYIGRHHPTEEGGHRMGFHLDNTVRYIFGTGFDETHREIGEDELAHHPHSHPDHLPDRTHELVKTRSEILEDLARKGETLTGPKPFGHVDTHPLDGGITPPKVVRVDPFFLDVHPVTNKQFAKFVKSTYYETEAEKFGWSFVLASFVPQSTQSSDWEVDPAAEHWVAVKGAYWRQPEGPSSSYKYRENHPVVHVSHRDAAEYCQWMGKRLPGEREWEAAARFDHYGPRNRTLYQWGEPHEIIVEETIPPNTSSTKNIGRTTHHIIDLDQEWNVAAKHANLWGPKPFPWENDAHDGWRGTSPVKHYPPNKAGLYDMIGNVWEWMRGGKHKARIVRGASYVDSLDGSFNVAATLGARDTAHGTTTAGNIGFRCARSPKRRTEYHWKWHDEEVDGVLAIEDELGERTTIETAQRSSESSSDWSEDIDDEHEEQKHKKKKKVAKKRELISTEL